MKLRQILALLLALITVFTVASCGKDGDTETQTTESSKESESETKMEDERITPEQLGISSADVKAMLDDLQKANLNMHSILVMKDSKIVAEAYADGYDENSLQRMYSVSKSFVGMAIGVLASDSDYDVSIEDKVCDYFKNNPKYATAVANADRRIKDTTIRDLLTMTSPYNKGSSYKGDSDTDWVMTFFTNSNDYALKEPGKTYLYDTGGTHLLGALVEEVTGKDFLEYLQEKALDEIGFSENAWCANAPEGYAWGGSGVLCTTRDLALFANLVMHEGEYGGKQLLPKEYVQQATKKQVDNSSEMGGEESYASHFYAAGYGYQIWKADYTEKSFAFIGMGDQNALCIPELDLLFVCTADNQGMSNTRTRIFQAFDENILQNISDTPLEENAEALALMDEALDEMKLPALRNMKSAPKAINGVTYATKSNAKISEFTLSFDGDNGTFKYKTPRGEKQLTFKLGENEFCTLQEPQYSGDTISVGNGKGYRSACSGSWLNDKTFVLSVQVVDDYLGNMKLTFEFDGNNKVKLTVKKNAEWFLYEYDINGVTYSKK